MADGLRAWKDSSGTATWYLYDGDQPVVETDGSGNVTAVDMFGADGLVERELASGQTAYLFDPQGNASERLTSAGTLKSSSIYDAFGAQTTTASTPDTYGFGAQYGYYTDTETGLELLTNRYYDPSTGRFVNEDPIGFAGGSDLYRYAGNNPINAVDPSGLNQLSVYDPTNPPAIQRFTIDIPDGQSIAANVKMALAVLPSIQKQDEPWNYVGNLLDRRDWLSPYVAPGTVGDWGRNFKRYPHSGPCDTSKTGPQQTLQWQRRLGGNFNFGAMAAALGVDLSALQVFAQGKANGMHLPVEQEAIADGFYYFYATHPALAASRDVTLPPGIRFNLVIKSSPP
jgi:RHS repeat-associated protein